MQTPSEEDLVGQIRGGLVGGQGDQGPYSTCGLYALMAAIRTYLLKVYDVELNFDCSINVVEGLNMKNFRGKPIEQDGDTMPHLVRTLQRKFEEGVQLFVEPDKRRLSLAIKQVQTRWGDMEDAKRPWTCTTEVREYFDASIGVVLARRHHNAHGSHFLAILDPGVPTGILAENSWGEAHPHVTVGEPSSLYPIFKAAYRISIPSIRIRHGAGLGATVRSMAVKVWPDGHRYGGELSGSGLCCGQGCFTRADGGRYVGEWHNNNFHGLGVRTWPQGGRYDGEWRDGERHGHGVETWPSGLRYDGEHLGDRRHGPGVETRPDGGHYDGEWRDGVRCGRGVETWPSGLRFEGEWHDDKRHGHGVETWPSGLRVEGEWHDDKRHGRGVHTRPNGESYEGEHRCDKFHGHGVYTWPDGHFYKGQWCDNERCGHGCETWPDGLCYVGQFRSGRRHGYGVQTWPNGEKLEGQWSYGLRHGTVTV